MKITRFSTQLTKADLLRTQRRAFFQPASLLRRLALWTLIVVVILIFWMGPSNAFSNVPAMLLSGFGGAMGSCAVLLLSELVKVWILSARMPGLLGAHHFELRDEGLFEKTDVDETLTKWSSIVNIQRGKDWINIEVQPGFIYHVPPGTFPEAAQLEALADELRSRVSAAKASESDN